MNGDFRIRDLRSWVELGSLGNPRLLGRFEKAAFIVLLRQVKRIDENTYSVQSEDGLMCYRVSNGACECSDFRRHGIGHRCKHVLAVEFVERVSRADQEKDAHGKRGQIPTALSRGSITSRIGI